MRAKTTKVTILIVLLVLSMVGYYAYLSGRVKDQKRSSAEQVSLLDTVLNRDLVNDYPSTPKEVMKYYNDIVKLLYGGTDDELSQDVVDDLAMKMRGLYDAELLAHNEMGTHLIRLRSEVTEYQEKGRRITNCSVASSSNVDYYSVDGYDFARLLCTYNVNEGGVSSTQKLIFLLRKDADRRWRIYGWDLEENVDLTGDSEDKGSDA